MSSHLKIIYKYIVNRNLAWCPKKGLRIGRYFGQKPEYLPRMAWTSQEWCVVLAKGSIWTSSFIHCKCHSVTSQPFNRCCANPMSEYMCGFACACIVQSSGSLRLRKGNAMVILSVLTHRSQSFTFTHYSRSFINLFFFFWGPFLPQQEK